MCGGTSKNKWKLPRERERKKYSRKGEQHGKGIHVRPGRGGVSERRSVTAGPGAVGLDEVKKAKEWIITLGLGGCSRELGSIP